MDSKSRRSFLFIPLLVLAVALAASAQNSPEFTSSSVKVIVPPSMRSSPFNVDRFLSIPQNFTISVYARVSGARFMAVAPNGDLLVSRPGAGVITLVRPNGSGDPMISTFVSGLNNPHDLVFHTVSGTTYLYVSESNQINRYVYTNGDMTGHGRQIIITNLPDSGSPGLGGYAHPLKNFAIDGNDKVYVEVSSSTNADPSDTTSNPVRNAIYQYDANGANGRLFARGIRNAEGLAFVPGSNNLWVVVNNRDNIAYPFHNGFQGDTDDDYGEVMQSYVDNHPPDEFMNVTDGANFGWPFANPSPDTASGLNNMPFDLDVETNGDGSNGTADSFTRVNKGIQAHSAPLGLTFLQGTAFPAAYQNGAVVALHGSWNRSTPTGDKVVYFPWTTGPGNQTDLVSGWLVGGNYWGRPVATAVDPAGNLLISDDQAGTIYKLSATAVTPPPPLTVQTFTLINADTDAVISDPLTDNATVDYHVIGTSNISVRANTSGGVVSVVFMVDGKVVETDNASPFAIAGNNGTNYLPWSPVLGAHTITAIPYPGTGGTGMAGTSAVVHITVVDTTPPPPGAPSDLTGRVVSATEIDLQWIDNSNNETGFKIERADGAGDFVQIGTTGANQATYHDMTIEHGVIYSYRVRATNSAGSSGYSNVAVVHPSGRMHAISHP